MDPNPWRIYLSEWEHHQLRQTEGALQHPPAPRSPLGQWTENKLGQLSQKVPETLKNQLTQAVAQALEGMRLGSNWLVSRDALYQKWSRRLGPIRGSLDLMAVPLDSLDALADEMIQSTRTGLTIEGAAAGAAGLVGLVADIPILYCSLFKTIQEIALLYGFPVKPPQERFHIIQVLDLGHCLHSPQRVSLVLHTYRMQSMIGSGTTVEALEAQQSMLSSSTHTQALARNLRLARQLALDLLERKLLQGLVLVGSAIGAAANYQLARDVGTAARHLYRRRFLMELALRRSGGSPPLV